MYDSKSLCNWFMYKGDVESIRIKDYILHKLIIYSHIWHLKYYNTRLLMVKDKVVTIDKCSVWGLMILSLIESHGDSAKDKINKKAHKLIYENDELILHNPVVNINDKINKFLEIIWNKYKNYEIADFQYIEDDENSPERLVENRLGSIRSGYIEYPDELLKVCVDKWDRLDKINIEEIKERKRSIII